jgi:hypothetical protein
MLYNYDSKKYDAEIRRENKTRAKQSRELTTKAWQYNDKGSAEPTSATLSNIYAAYADAYTSDNYWY